MTRSSAATSRASTGRRTATTDTSERPIFAKLQTAELQAVQTLCKRYKLYASGTNFMQAVQTLCKRYDFMQAVWLYASGTMLKCHAPSRDWMYVRMWPDHGSGGILRKGKTIASRCSRYCTPRSNSFACKWHWCRWRTIFNASAEHTSTHRPWLGNELPLFFPEWDFYYPESLHWLYLQGCFRWLQSFCLFEGFLRCGPHAHVHPITWWGVAF